MSFFYLYLMMALPKDGMMRWMNWTAEVEATGDLWPCLEITIPLVVYNFSPAVSQISAEKRLLESTKTLKTCVAPPIQYSTWTWLYLLILQNHLHGILRLQPLQQQQDPFRQLYTIHNLIAMLFKVKERRQRKWHRWEEVQPLPVHSWCKAYICFIVHQSR